ncbi:DUF5719 family protein [Nostocoides veronense]|uniref:Secreted protein n=1 Tax=Nostocoides veronense TaxID=330836 RepID=A0ABP4XQI6_9MICO
MTGAPGIGLAALRLAGVGAAGAALVVGAPNLAARDIRPPAEIGQASQKALDRVEIACPGGIFAGIEDVDDLAVPTTVVASTAPADTLGGVSPSYARGKLIVMTGTGQSFPHPGRSGAMGGVGDRGAADAADLEGAAPTVVTGSGSLAPGALAGQESDVASDSATGFATTGCGAPVAEAWLTAGGGQPGRQERLVLVNAGANPVTVDIDVLGSRGSIEAPAARGIVVEGRSRTAVLLDALAPQETSPFFHLTMRGGFISAQIGDAWMDGITPRGIETVAPLAAPAMEQVIAGVPGGQPVTVRLANTGEEQAIVEVRLLTADGPRALPGAVGIARIAAGTATDIAIGALPKGTNGLQVRSDLPVTGAALVQPKNARDFAWVTASEPLAGLSGAVYQRLEDPENRTRTLALATTGDGSSVEVTTMRNGVSTARTVSLAADCVTTVDLTGTDAVWVRPADGGGVVRAGILITGPAGDQFVLASTPLTPSRLTRTAVQVTPVGSLG